MSNTVGINDNAGSFISKLNAAFGAAASGLQIIRDYDDASTVIGKINSNFDAIASQGGGGGSSVEGTVINVKTDFGAVGDGTTDDTSALETAFAAAVSQKKAVYVPAGTYLIKRPLTIKSGMEIYGAGNTSIIKKIPAYWSKTTSAVAAGSTVIPVTDASGFHVGEHCFLTNKNYAQIGNQVGARHCSFGTITAVDTTNNTVTIESAYNSIKSGVVKDHVNGCWLSTSFPILRSWSFKDDCIDVYIHDICLDGNRQTTSHEGTSEPWEWTNACIHFDAYGAVAVEGIPYSGHSYNHIIENCKLINAAYDGISDQGEGGLIVKGCTITNCAMHGIHLGTTFSGAVISGNTMTGNGVNGAGVFCCQSVTDVVVTGNTITNYNHGCSDEEYGTVGKFLIIRNNTFSGITSYVFDFLFATSASHGGGLLIIGNKIQNLKAIMFAGDFLDNVIIANNQVQSITTTPSNLIWIGGCSCVVINGNTWPSGTSISTPIKTTDENGNNAATNVINTSNSWN